jgi:hypothetical protein
MVLLLFEVYWFALIYSERYYQSIHHQDMVTFLANHLSIDEQLRVVHTTLAWHSFRKARKECSFPMQKFISKWLSGDTATGLVMKRRKQRLHAHCPLCGEDDEHLLHVLICPDVTAVDFRKPLLTELETWLIDEDTDPDIAGYLLTGLTSGNSLCRTFHSTGSDPSVTGNWLVRPSLRFYSGTIGYLPTSVLLFHPISTKRRTLGNMPYSSTLENLTPHLDSAT